MKLFHKIAAAAALMLASGTAHAQAWQEVGDWSIYKNADHCRAISTFQKVLVSVAYYKADNRTTMMILDDTIFASAQNRAKFDAIVVFVKGEDIVTDFVDLPITGVQLENGTKGVFVQSPGDSFLTTFSQSSIVGLLKGQDVVVSIKIEMPSAMIAAVRKCASGG